MRDLEKKFPSFFANFNLPTGACEQNLSVYRACRTCTVDEESFLPTYIENGLKCLGYQDPSDPGIYSLSTYEKPKDVKRFAALDGKFQPPYKIAKGFTSPNCGLVQRTKERKKKSGSHVDWWLYEDAKPYEHFTLINNFETYYEEYKRKKGV